MGRVSKYPEELRERAVRMVAEVRPQYPSQWARSPRSRACWASALQRRCGPGFAARRWIPANPPG